MDLPFIYKVYNEIAVDREDIPSAVLLDEFEDLKDAHDYAAYHNGIIWQYKTGAIEIPLPPNGEFPVLVANYAQTNKNLDSHP